MKKIEKQCRSKNDTFVIKRKSIDKAILGRDKYLLYEKDMEMPIFKGNNKGNNAFAIINKERVNTYE